jgi:hypothetical protein
MGYTHNGVAQIEYYSVIKDKVIMSFAGKCVELETISLNEKFLQV